MDTRSAFGWGLVCHALTGAMRDILDDWHLLVTQLEHKQAQGKLDLAVSLSAAKIMGAAAASVARVAF